MKSLTLVAIILLMAAQSFAQANTSTNSQQERLTYYNKVEKYRKMKNTGTFLTVVGGALSVIGIVIVANSSIETIDDGYSTKTIIHGHPYGGLAMAVLGHAALGTGIPLLIIGNSNNKKYQRKLDQLTVSFKSNPQTSGLTLAYHF